MVELNDTEKAFVKKCLDVYSIEYAEAMEGIDFEERHTIDDEIREMLHKADKLDKRIDRFGYMPCERPVILGALGKVRDKLDKLPHFEETLGLRKKINTLLQKLYTPVLENKS
jgi:hypothetical protein